MKQMSSWLAKGKFIKCSNYIFHKKDLLYISRDGKDIEIHLLVDNKQYILNEYFNNSKAAIEECNSIFEQLQAVEMEESQPKKYKITLKEFWNSKEKLAIHCNTEEEAKKLLKAFDKLGKKWCDGDSYLADDCYYRRDTCYDNNCEHSYYDFYKKCNYIIYEFGDVDLDN